MHVTTKFATFFGILGLVAVAVWLTGGRPGHAAPPVAGSAAGSAGSATETPAVARARREVRLLDDIYKTAIVLITKHYVEGDSDLPAGEAFKVLFAGMAEKGWHEVRLLDATGDPLNSENAPQDDFERRAIKALLDGAPDYEEQTVREGRSYLRAATPLPIVMDKCKMCHANYADQKVVGALGYTLPLDGETNSGK